MQVEDEMTFNEIIERLLDEGIEIVMSKEDGTVWYNLNTMMKSELLIAEKGDNYIYKARYGKAGEFETYRELLRLATNCMHGRDFANHHWIALLVKEGYLK
jgi:hypothetical protein